MNLVLALLLAFIPLHHAEAFQVPPNDGYVTDTAGILTKEQEADLEQKLSVYKEQTSNQIAILIIPSLNGEDIADVAVQIGRAWGIGTKEHDNGILLLVAYEDRNLFLATGYGLEGAIPDIVAKGIVDTDIVPKFKEGKYYEGLIAGLEAIRKHIAGEYTADRYAQAEQESGLVAGIGLVVLFLFLQWGFAVMARTKSWWFGGVFGGVLGVVLTLLFNFWLTIPLFIVLGLALDYLVSKNHRAHGKTKWWAGGGWGPGGSGGGGRGGFGGFGGGSFGGGGAGSKW